MGSARKTRWTLLGHILHFMDDNFPPVVAIRFAYITSDNIFKVVQGRSHFFLVL